MYAVIRAGGKQYRVAPGDVVRIEKLPANQGDTVEFNDVLALSAEQGKIGPGTDVVVSGQVVESGRADKILVFHFKRKKQYKKIYGHRQPYTQVRITEITFDGQSFKAPALPERKPKPAPRPKAEAAGGEEAAHKHAAHSKGKAGAHKKAKKAAPKAAAKKSAAKKSSSSKKKKK